MPPFHVSRSHSLWIWALTPHCTPESPAFSGALLLLQKYRAYSLGSFAFLLQKVRVSLYAAKALAFTVSIVLINHSQPFTVVFFPQSIYYSWKWPSNSIVLNDILFNANNVPAGVLLSTSIYFQFIIDESFVWLHCYCRSRLSMFHLLQALRSCFLLASGQLIQRHGFYLRVSFF